MYESLQSAAFEPSINEKYLDSLSPDELVAHEAKMREQFRLLAAQSTVDSHNADATADEMEAAAANTLDTVRYLQEFDVYAKKRMARERSELENT